MSPRRRPIGWWRGRWSGRRRTTRRRWWCGGCREVGGRRHGARWRCIMSRLDWNDREAVRRWVIDLRVVVDDLDAVIADMLRPPRARELGHAVHREKWREARDAIVSALAYAIPPDDGDDGP